MIIGIGVDIVEVSRFAAWHTYSKERLLKVFTDREINYCLSVPVKSAERFAGRFAAKEACYKALSPQIPFASFYPFAEVVLASNGAPSIALDCAKLGIDQGIKILLSTSHSKSAAIAMVVAEKP